MSRTFKDSLGKGRSDQRRVVARGVKRRPIDYRKLSRALLELAEAQAETDAANQTQQPGPKSEPDTSGDAA